MNPDKFKFRPFTKADAGGILTWRYPEPYHIYNAPGPVTADAIDHLLQPELHYYAVTGEHGEMIAFRCFGPDARVPGGDYSASALDLGGGLRPDLTGQGLGYHIIAAAMHFALANFQPVRFRTTVAGFNIRALKVCHRLGYEPEQEFDRKRDGLRFIVLSKTARSSLSTAANNTSAAACLHKQL